MNCYFFILLLTDAVRKKQWRHDESPFMLQSHASYQIGANLQNSSSLCALVVAFVLGRIDDCNSLYAGCTQTVLQGLQRAQSTAARLLTGTGRLKSALPLMRDLHFLPYRAKYNTSCVRWCTRSCMVPYLATSLICVIRVEMCDCDPVLVRTTSFHSVHDAEVVPFFRLKGLELVTE